MRGPERRQCPVRDGDIVPASNQTVSLREGQKYAIAIPHCGLSARHPCKNEFPVPAFAYPVRNRLTKKGPDPACEPDPEIDMLKDVVDKALDEAETKEQRPATVWEQHERDGRLPKDP